MKRRVILSADLTALIKEIINSNLSMQILYQDKTCMYNENREASSCLKSIDSEFLSQYFRHVESFETTENALRKILSDLSRYEGVYHYYKKYPSDVETLDFSETVTKLKALINRDLAEGLSKKETPSSEDMLLQRIKSHIDDNTTLYANWIKNINDQINKFNNNTISQKDAFVDIFHHLENALYTLSHHNLEYLKSNGLLDPEDLKKRQKTQDDLLPFLKELKKLGGIGSTDDITFLTKRGMDALADAIRTIENPPITQPTVQTPTPPVVQDDMSHKDTDTSLVTDIFYYFNRPFSCHDKYNDARAKIFELAYKINHAGDPGNTNLREIYTELKSLHTNMKVDEKNDEELLTQRTTIDGYIERFKKLAIEPIEQERHNQPQVEQETRERPSSFVTGKMALVGAAIVAAVAYLMSYMLG